MLLLEFFREQKERVVTGLLKRNWAQTDIDALMQSVLETDELRRAKQTEGDNLLSDINRQSKQIGELMKSGQKVAAESARHAVTTLKEKTKILEEEKTAAEKKLRDILLNVPNLPNACVPYGKTPEENIVYKDWVKPFPELGDAAQPHWELAQKYNIFDLELGVKITGAGFPVFRGKGARLVRALIQFFLDEASAAGYEEIVPPLLVNEDSALGTGQLPDKEGQMYYAAKDDLYLIPTAEVPLTNIYRDVILTEKELPIKLTGYTPCFRREAGSYGAHVRGLNRVHQFDKIEIVQITTPENSNAAHHQMIAHIETLLEKLELPYRILNLCGGDMGSASAHTYDFEVWSAAQKRWLEVSSVSNFDTYQANRLRSRYKNADGKIQLTHTLNGSALALARIIAAIIENHQTPDGIKIPPALQPYTRFELLN